MKYKVINRIGHKTVARDFVEAEQAYSYIRSVCDHNSFTTPTVTKLTNDEIYITIWDTMY